MTDWPRPDFGRAGQKPSLFGNRAGSDEAAMQLSIPISPIRAPAVQCPQSQTMAGCSLFVDRCKLLFGMLIAHSYKVCVMNFGVT